MMDSFMWDFHGLLEIGNAQCKGSLDAGNKTNGIQPVEYRAIFRGTEITRRVLLQVWKSEYAVLGYLFHNGCVFLW